MYAKMDEFKNDLKTAIVMVGVGALAGVAALLRDKEPVTRRAIIGAVLNSGIFCGGFYLLMSWAYGNENFLLNVGMSVMAGLGGNTAIGIGMKTWGSFVKSASKGNDDV